MIELITLIALTSIWNIGIEIVLSDGMALENLRRWAQSKESKWYEPLVYCIWCRPSLHSIIGYIAAIVLGVVNVHWRLVFIYPLVVAGSSLVSGVIWNAYKLIEIKIKYFGHLEKQEYFNLKERKKNFNQNKK